MSRIGGEYFAVEAFGFSKLSSLVMVNCVAKQFWYSEILGCW